MKKFFLPLFILPVFLLGQNVKHDSLFLDGRLIGKISILEKEANLSTIYNPSNSLLLPENSSEEKKIHILSYMVAIDEFLSKKDISRVERYFFSFSEDISKKSNGNRQVEYKIWERFQGKSNSQIAGFYLLKAGELKNSRNNWALVGPLIGGVVSACIILKSPQTFTTIFVALGTGGLITTISGIVALGKDYQANEMIKNAGLILIK